MPSLKLSFNAFVEQLSLKALSLKALSFKALSFNAFVPTVIGTQSFLQGLLAGAIFCDQERFRKAFTRTQAYVQKWEGAAGDWAVCFGLGRHYGRGPNKRGVKVPRLLRP